jgi:CO/xanthine dehydrogenase Mo-binding subunit
MSDFLTIGKPEPRVDGFGKVSGEAVYAKDFSLPGLLWGKAVRSQLPHARILRVDASRAKARPGVVAVLTAEEIPDILVGKTLRDMPMLARDRARFIGEKIAVVAAEDPDIAAEAAALVEVEYEELPAVFDPIEAMQEGAPILHEGMASYIRLPELPSKLPNVHSEVRLSIGNVEEGFRLAKRVFENSFTTQMVHQGYLEPHAATVAVDSSGRIQVWASTKTPYGLRRNLARAVDVPEEKVVVHLLPMGGDFGAKSSLMDVPLCYFIAKKSRRPVKMVMSYEEELMAACPRHPSVIKIRSGVDEDRRICAHKIEIVLNSGAYGAFKPNKQASLSGVENGAGAYFIPNAAIAAYCVYTNCVPCGHMRAPGEPQVIFALESHMDMMARELGIDPVEFRLRNALKDGDPVPSGHGFEKVRCRETIEAAAKAANWGRPRARPNVGRGIAVSHRHIGRGDSSAEVSVERDGRGCLVTAVPDTGTGAHTILRQIVAETLTIPPERVKVIIGNTDALPFDDGSSGSRVSHVAGQAALKAATAAKSQLLEEAAKELECQAEEVVLKRGRLYGGRKALSLEQLCEALFQRGGEIKGKESYEGDYAPLTCFAAQVAEVEVDRETGRVKVLKIVTAHDVGTILNPLTHQGQIEGGVIQGFGYALMEELKVEDGRITALNLGDLKLPNIQDVPDFKTVLVQEPAGSVPFNGKSIGEHSISPVAAAIANAVYDAVGVRVTELPITAEKVYIGLQRKS